MPAQPFISIVIATYNAFPQIKHCLESIFQQTFTNYEVIVIDKASQDETIEFIRGQQNRIAYWESKTDKGIYHAWNKALRHTRGTWICFLGSDDKFAHSTVLERMAPHLQHRSAHELFVFKCG